MSAFLTMKESVVPETAINVHRHTTPADATVRDLRSKTSRVIIYKNNNDKNSKK